jgi:hypothetical protein
MCAFGCVFVLVYACQCVSWHVGLYQQQALITGCACVRLSIHFRALSFALSLSRARARARDLCILRSLIPPPTLCFSHTRTMARTFPLSVSSSLLSYASRFVQYETNVVCSVPANNFGKDFEYIQFQILDADTVFSVQVLTFTDTLYTNAHTRMHAVIHK